MEKEEVIHKLKELQGDGCIEINHIEADYLICEFLKHLGYEDVVSEFEKIDKWYA